MKNTAVPPKTPHSKPDIRIRSTIPFKLKDKKGRQYKAFNLFTQFGFLPETIIITKEQGNHRIFLSAVLTKEEMAKEDKLKKKTKLSEIAPTTHARNDIQ